MRAIERCSWPVLLLATAALGRSAAAQVQLEVRQGTQWTTAASISQLQSVAFRWRWSGKGTPASAERQTWIAPTAGSAPPASLTAPAGTLIKTTPITVPAVQVYAQFTVGTSELPKTLPPAFYVRVLVRWAGSGATASPWVAVASASASPLADTRATPTSVDLSLAMAKQVLDGPSEWVTQLTLGVPQSVTFRWGRPAAAYASRTTERSQWQMAFAAAAPAGPVTFLEGTTASLFTGSVPPALPGATANFTIGANRLPAKPAGGAIWVRVVLSSSEYLRASPWVKIAMVGGGDPVVINDETYVGTDLWLTQTEVECVRTTDDGSPDDEIYVAVGAVDLKAPPGSARRASAWISPVYHNVVAGKTLKPYMTFWGTDDQPRPISAPADALILVQLYEWDGEMGGSPGPAAWLESALAAALDDLRQRGYTGSELRQKLAGVFSTALYRKYGDGGISEDADDGIGVDQKGVLVLTSTDIDAARQGRIVRKELFFAQTCCWGGGRDDALYKVRFQLGRKGTTAQ